MSLKIILFLTIFCYVDVMCSADPSCTSVLQNDCTSLTGVPQTFCQLQGTWYLQRINLPPNFVRCAFYTFSTTEDDLQYMVSAGYYNGTSTKTTYTYRVIRNDNGRIEFAEYPTPMFVYTAIFAVTSSDGFGLVGCYLWEGYTGPAVYIFTKLANPPSAVITDLILQLQLKGIDTNGLNTVNQTVCY